MSKEEHLTRRWDWLSALLVFLLIRIAATRLVTTEWAETISIVGGIATLGCVLGLALGASRYHRGAVACFIIGYTLTIVPWRLSAGFSSSPLAVGQRLLISSDQFLRGRPVNDPLFFVTFVSLSLWIIAIVAGYQLIRHGNTPAAVLPAGILTLIVQVYDNDRPLSSWWLAAYLIIALILLGRQYYLGNQKEWKKDRVFVSQDTWPNISSGLIMTVAAAVILAWLLPTSLSSIQTVTDTWNNITRPVRDGLSNAVSSLNSTYNGENGIQYGNTFSLGNRATQGENTVFTVNVLSGPEEMPRFYWRGRAYNSYREGQWASINGSKSKFDPANDIDGLIFPNPTHRQDYDLAFILQIPEQSLLYAPSEPVWVNHDSIITSDRAGQGQSDLLAWEFDPPLRKGNQYEVRAEIANPSASQLREAGTDYPAWVKTSYLEIPSGIKPELRALTEQITTGQTTPFDQASAVTSYLRNTIQYSTLVPVPPAGRDPIVWVLLDYRKGYCNYYASAEVLMLRSIGVPARLAVGYAEGNYDKNQNSFTVKGQDAHAWPEVYFPNIGWIEFEPTANQYALTRRPLSGAGNPRGNSVLPPLAPPDGGAQAGTPPEQVAIGGSSALPFLRTPIGVVILIALLGIVAIFFVILYRARSFKNLPAYLSQTLERNGLGTPSWIENWMRWSQLQPVERSFASVNLSLRWLGQPQPIHVTPAERATLLKQLLPRASEHIEALTSELQSGLFTRHPADLSRARRAGLMIILLTWRALIRKDGT